MEDSAESACALVFVPAESKHYIIVKPGNR